MSLTGLADPPSVPQQHDVVYMPRLNLRRKDFRTATGESRCSSSAMIQRSRRAVQLIGILAIASIWLLYQLFSPPRYRREDVVSDQTVRLRDEADYILSKSSWGFDAPPTTRRFQFVISDVEARPDGKQPPCMKPAVTES